MDHLWAPWRMEFILQKREEGCIFCRLPREEERRRENLILHIGEKAFVVLNRYPYTCGHLMVIPVRHTSDFLSLTAEENAQIAVQLQIAVRSLREAYRPEGFNLGTNLGRPGGAGIREHLHHHVVPRWIGDSNFFPILGEARAMPEYLHETYDRLRPHFLRAAEEGLLAPAVSPPPEPDPPESRPAGSGGDARPPRTRARGKRKGGEP